jgi:hypothetical protein
MIIENDVIELCKMNGIKLTNYLLKDNKSYGRSYLNRVVDLLNHLLLEGNNSLEISQSKFIDFLGERFCNTFLFAADSDLNPELPFFNDKKVLKQLNISSDFMKLLFYRVKRGSKFENGNFSISVYKVNPSIIIPQTVKTTKQKSLFHLQETVK